MYTGQNMEFSLLLCSNEHFHCIDKREGEQLVRYANE